MIVSHRIRIERLNQLNMIAAKTNVITYKPPFMIFTSCVNGVVSNILYGGVDDCDAAIALKNDIAMDGGCFTQTKDH